MEIFSDIGEDVHVQIVDVIHVHDHAVVHIRDDIVPRRLQHYHLVPVRPIHRDHVVQVV